MPPPGCTLPAPAVGSMMISWSGVELHAEISATMPAVMRGE
jgi:hypothetical protein